MIRTKIADQCFKNAEKSQENARFFRDIAEKEIVSFYFWLFIFLAKYHILWRNIWYFLGIKITGV